MKYKVGDTVIIGKKVPCCPNLVGKIGEVEKLDVEDRYDMGYRVRFIGDGRPFLTHWYMEENLKEATREQIALHKMRR